MVCLRAKASSCVVRSAERRAVFVDLLEVVVEWVRRGHARQASSVLPMITVSMLLKSWATPPATRPTASIF